MKSRRHHNNKGLRQTRTGKTRFQVENMAKRLGVPHKVGKDAEAVGQHPDWETTGRNKKAKRHVIKTDRERGFEGGAFLTSSFVGVNVGYQGEQACVKDPAVAVRTVQDTLSDMGFKPLVFPGHVVYAPYDEVVAAVFPQTSGHMKPEDFDALRQALGQKSLAVSVPPDRGGVQTVGFRSVVASSAGMGALVKRWKALAVDHGGVFVSGAVFEADGQTYIQGEANPNPASSGYVSDLELWRRNVQFLAYDLGAEDEPVFRDVGLHYFRG